MPENTEILTDEKLDLNVEDVTDAGWNDLVSQMMSDELDAMALAMSALPSCYCLSGC